MRRSARTPPTPADEKPASKPARNRQTHHDDPPETKRPRRAARQPPPPSENTTTIVAAKPEALTPAPSGLKQEGGGGGGGGSGEGGPSAYELERLENMKRNALVMASLGLGNAKGAMRTAVQSEAAQRARSRGLSPRQPRAYPPRSRYGHHLRMKRTDVRI